MLIIYWPWLPYIYIPEIQGLTFPAFCCFASDFDLNQCFVMASSMLVSFQWAEFHCNVSFGATGFNTIKSRLCKGTPFCTEPLKFFSHRHRLSLRKSQRSERLGVYSQMVTHWARMAIALATLDGDERYVITTGRRTSSSHPLARTFKWWCRQSPVASDKASLSIDPIFLPPPAAWNLNGQKWHYVFILWLPIWKSLCACSLNGKV